MRVYHLIIKLFKKLMQAEITLKDVIQILKQRQKRIQQTKKIFLQESKARIKILEQGQKKRNEQKKRIDILMKSQSQFSIFKSIARGLRQWISGSKQTVNTEDNNKLQSQYHQASKFHEQFQDQDQRLLLEQTCPEQSPCQNSLLNGNQEGRIGRGDNKLQHCIKKKR